VIQIHDDFSRHNKNSALLQLPDLISNRINFFLQMCADLMFI